MVLQSHTFLDTSLVLTIFDSTVVVALALYSQNIQKGYDNAIGGEKIDAYVVSVAHIDVIVFCFCIFRSLNIQLL